MWQTTALELQVGALLRTFFVTSVRGSDFAPQMAAKAGLKVFLAKMPFPAFFIARAFFLADALLAILPAVFFAALIFFLCFSYSYSNFWLIFGKL